MRKMCKQCPFHKNSSKGYLGGVSLEDTLEVVNSESDFLCHLTRETDKEEQCVGRLLRSIKICKMFRGQDLEDQKLELKESDELSEVLSFEFKQHHTI